MWGASPHMNVLKCSLSCQETGTGGVRWSDCGRISWSVITCGFSQLLRLLRQKSPSQSGQVKKRLTDSIITVWALEERSAILMWRYSQSFWIKIVFGFCFVVFNCCLHSLNTPLVFSLCIFWIISYGLSVVSNPAKYLPPTQTFTALTESVITAGVFSP